jgi:hypothetical protein
MKQFIIASLLIGYASASSAQTPSPAQMGLVVATPNVVQVLDSSKNWATIGTVDPTTHLFAVTGLPPLVTSFNTRTGAVTLTSSDVTTALGFTPLSTPYVLPIASTTVLGGVKVDGSTISINGSGVISGAPSGITANSTATNGFNAQQLIMSDGSKVQAVGSGSVVNLNTITYPAYMGAFNSGYAGISFLGTGTPGYGGVGFGVVPGYSASVTIDNGAGGSGCYSFVHDTNAVGGCGDTAFSSDGYGIAAFRNWESPTSAETLRVYNAYTDASNGEWGGFDWATTPNVLTIATQHNGTGLARGMVLRGAGPATNEAALYLGSQYAGWTSVGGNGGFIPATDNFIPLGSTGNRWQTIYSLGYNVGASNLAGVSCTAGQVSVSTLGIVTGCGASGGITAGTTSTSGFTAGQLAYSDGTKIQASGGNDLLQVGAGMYLLPPGYLGAANWLGISSTPSTAGMSVAINSNGLISSYGGIEVGTYPTAPASVTYASNGVARAAIFDYASGGTAMALDVFNIQGTGNDEWATLDWKTVANTLLIGTEKNGTGTARNLELIVGGVNKLDYGVTVANVWTAATNFGTSGAFVARGTQPTIAGAGGTCAVTTKVGGATAGTVVLSAVCATTNTITFTGMPAVPNGYSCDAEDRVTQTAGPFIQSASTTTGFTLKVGATSSVAADVLQWKCMGY